MAPPVTPQEAQAVYVAADEGFQKHARSCGQCGNSRRKYHPYCSEGIRLSEVAFSRRQDWGAAVAAVRAAAERGK